MATTFIDKARITVRAGNGGNGVVRFSHLGKDRKQVFIETVAE